MSDLFSIGKTFFFLNNRGCMISGKLTALVSWRFKHGQQDQWRHFQHAKNNDMQNLHDSHHKHGPTTYCTQGVVCQKTFKMIIRFQVHIGGKCTKWISKNYTNSHFTCGTILPIFKKAEIFFLPKYLIPKDTRPKSNTY